MEPPQLVVHRLDIICEDFGGHVCIYTLQGMYKRYRLVSMPNVFIWLLSARVSKNAMNIRQVWTYVVRTFLSNAKNTISDTAAGFVLSGLASRNAHPLPACGIYSQHRLSRRPKSCAMQKSLWGGVQSIGSAQYITIHLILACYDLCTRRR